MLKVLLIILTIILQLFPVDPPIKPKKLLIKDKEMLKYSIMVRGEKFWDINIVSRINADGKTIKVYTGKYQLGSRYPMPKHYTNYQRQFVVSLERGTLLSGFGDYWEQYKLDQKTGEVRFDITVDYEKNLAVYVSRIWDGYDMRKKTTRVKLTPGYPVWDVPSVAFVASRFLDLNSGGMMYGVYPEIVKEAVPVVAKRFSKETVKTPAGTFETVKYGVGITDPFLAKLLESYIREMHVWLEDSPRSLVVKTQSPEEIYLLQEITSWEE